MFKKMMIPYDLSDDSRESLFVGERFLKEDPTYELYVVHAIPFIATSYYGEAELTLGIPADITPKIESKIRGDLHSLGYSSNLLNQVKIEVSWGDPVSVILAQEAKVDFITMTTHGRSGFKKFLMGSVAEKIMQQAEKPVFIVRSAPKIHPQKIVVPVTFQEENFEVLKRLVSLYPESNHEYHLVHVLGESDLFGMYQQMMDQPLNINEELLNKLATDQMKLLVSKVFTKPVVTKILSGDIAVEIANYVSSIHADMAVLTTHHKGGLRHFFLGSESEKLVRQLSVNVLCLSA